MRKQNHPEQFSIRRGSGERFLALAIYPDPQASPRDISTSRSDEQNLRADRTNTTADTGGTARAMKGVSALPSLVVVAERASPDDIWSSDILYLQPCLVGFMVPRVIGKAYTRIIKLLWDSVTWVGLAMKRRTVSCLVTVTEHDVCLGEIGEGGDVSGVCREEFRAAATDCIFQPWVPRVIYISRDGAGEIDFNFESNIKTTKHVYHVILHDDSDISASAVGQAYQGEQHPVTPALTCLGFIKERNEVLVGDNRGLIYTYGGVRTFLTRQRQLTFPFPLAKLVVNAGTDAIYLAGLAATSEAARSKSNTNAGILRVNLSLATPPVFQALGDGRVLGMAWYHSSVHPLLTTVEEKLGMVHHTVQGDTEKTPVEAFAAKPLDMLSGEIVWGSGGWLAYITGDEAVLEREPAVHTVSDE